MKQREKGFTLLEAVIGMAIMALVVGAMATTTMTLLMNYEQAAEQSVALPQVQTVGYWISRDVQMSRSVNSTDLNRFPLTLTIPVSDNTDNDYSIDYLFEGSKLKRKVYDSSGNLTTETLIADYIDTDNTIFSTVNATIGLYKLTVTASRDGAGVTRSYEISQRLSPG